MATAGYLISRAAERPPILSLMVTIVAVQFFGIGRPRRPLPRAARVARHDAARPRPAARAVLRADRAARPGPARRLPQGGPALADGRRRRRPAEPVPARPRAAARRAAGRRRFGRGRERASCPPPGSCSPAGLLAGGLAVPGASLLARRPGRPPAGGRPRAAVGRADRVAPARARSSSRSARDRRRSSAFVTRRPRLGQAGPPRRVRHRGLADGLGLLVTGVDRRRRARSSRSWRIGPRCARHRVLIATLALLALASFEAVTPLAAAARELSATLAAGRRVLELTDQPRRSRIRRRPRRGTAVAVRGRARGRHRAVPADSRGRRSHGVNLRLEAGERVALLGPSGAGQDDGREPAAAVPRPGAAGTVTMAGRDAARLPPGGRPARDLGRRPGLAPVLRQHPGQRAPRAAGRERRRSRAGAAPSADLGLDLHRCPTDSTRSSARRGASCPAASASGSCWRGRCSPAAPVLVLDEPTAHLDRAPRASSCET